MYFAFHVMKKELSYVSHDPLPTPSGNPGVMNLFIDLECPTAHGRHSLAQHNFLGLYIRCLDASRR